MGAFILRGFHHSTDKSRPLGPLVHGENDGENGFFAVFLRFATVAFCVFSSATCVMAQSHPGWWRVIAPESRSLVGIDWANLRNSPFGEALRAELSAAGSLALPELPCLMEAHEFLIASPPLLAAANGGCSPAKLRAEAGAHGMQLSAYRGIDLWIATPAPTPDAPGLGASELSVCQLNERVVLVGSLRSLQAAIDRSLAQAHTYSPLLIQGARLARTRDLWVVATELPDPLASIFVPFDPGGMKVANFEGGIALRDGLDLGAILDAGSEAAAAQVAATIRKSVPQFPAVAKDLRIATNRGSVTLGLQVASDALQASLRQSDHLHESDADTSLPIETAVGTAAAHVPVTSTAPKAPVTPSTPPTPVTSKATPAPAASPAAPAPTATVSPSPHKLEPQIIRIYGLDDGPREIVLPPKQPW